MGGDSFTEIAQGKLQLCVKLQIAHERGSAYYATTTVCVDVRNSTTPGENEVLPILVSQAAHNLKSGLANKQASLLSRADHDDATKNNESSLAVL